MYKQGPAGHEECELNCSGKGDAGKSSSDHLGAVEQLQVGFLSLRCWGGGPGSGLRFSSSPFIWIESAWKTNQALADNM